MTKLESIHDETGMAGSEFVSLSRVLRKQREAEAPKRVKKPAPSKPAPVASDDGQGSLF